MGHLSLVERLSSSRRFSLYLLKNCLKAKQKKSWDLQSFIIIYYSASFWQFFQWQLQDGKSNTTSIKTKCRMMQSLLIKYIINCCLHQKFFFYLWGTVERTTVVAPEYGGIRIRYTSSRRGNVWSVVLWGHIYRPLFCFTLVRAASMVSNSAKIVLGLQIHRWWRYKRGWQASTLRGVASLFTEVIFYRLRYIGGWSVSFVLSWEVSASRRFITP